MWFLRGVKSGSPKLENPVSLTCSQSSARLPFLFPVLWGHIKTESSSVNLKSCNTVLFHLPLSKKNPWRTMAFLWWPDDQSFKPLLLCIFLTYFEAKTKESSLKNKDDMLVSLPVCQWHSLQNATQPKDKKDTMYLWLTKEKLVPRYNSLLETNIGEFVYPTAISGPVLNWSEDLKAKFFSADIDTLSISVN